MRRAHRKQHIKKRPHRVYATQGSLLVLIKAIKKWRVMGFVFFFFFFLGAGNAFHRYVDFKSCKQKCSESSEIVVITIISEL